jgi:hypothetical protein
MVVVDRFSKMSHFRTLHETATMKDPAQASVKEVWKLHRLPKLIISNQDTNLASKLLHGLSGLFGIRKRMSTSFHPQMDEQTERVNQTVETYIPTFFNYHQDYLYSLLPLTEFIYNKSVTQATQLIPFYTNYRFHPRTI